MIKRILMGLFDPDCAANEIQHAVELARLHHAEITAITPVDTASCRMTAPAQDETRTSAFRSHSASRWARELAQEQQSVLCEQTVQCVDQLQEACERVEIPYHVETITGDPFEFITGMSRYHDLFLCSSRRLLASSILDGTGDSLVRLVSAGVRPILAVPEQTRPLRRVMIAYSGSLDSAKTMKRFIQSQLVPVLSLKLVAIDQPEHQARVHLSEAAKYCRAHGYHAEIEYLGFANHTGFLQHAEDWGADLIVLGNSDRGLLSRMFFRDTSLDIIRQAHSALFLAQ